MLWLAVHLPDLSLAVHRRAQARPNEAALAVASQGRIQAADRLAQTQGISPGQNTATALAICPSLRLLEPRPEAEAQLLAHMAQSCLALTPTVVLKPPQALLLEVGGCLALFRGLPALLKRLRQILRHFAVETAIALAHTPKAAQLLAMGSAAADSLALTPPLQTSAVVALLHRQPCQHLPWPPAQHKTLQQLQLLHMGDLLSLPRAALSKRLGTPYTQYLAQLLGEVADPQQAISPAEEFQASLFFLDGISHSEGLRFPMRRLLDDFCLFLRQRQLQCPRLYWKFSHQDKSRQQLLISSSDGAPDSLRWLRLSELRLDTFQISAPVEMLSLEAHEFSSAQARPLSLLPDTPQAQQGTQELLDRLRARLGTDAVLYLHAQDQHDPAAAQRLRPQPSALSSAQLSPARPFWLWPQARPLPTAHRQPWQPAGFVLLRGPERMALPAENNEGAVRDYYLARHANGAHYWLYYEAATQSWFCQGLWG